MTVSMLFLLTTFLAVTKLGVSVNETFGECLPYNWSCTVCYHTLKVSLLKRDDNVRKLSETFFPPSANEPELVEVTYSFGEDHINPQVWFWTHDSSYLFFPIETFQYLSLFFGKPAVFFSQKVSLTLDLECNGLDHNLLLLLTQRLKNFIQKASFNPEIDNNYYARSRQDFQNSTGDILSNKTARYILSFYIVGLALMVAITLLLLCIYQSTKRWDEKLTSLSTISRANKYTQSKIISVTFVTFTINLYILILDAVAITNIDQSDIEEPGVLHKLPYVVISLDSFFILFGLIPFTLGVCSVWCAEDKTYLFFAISTLGPIHSMVIHLPYIFIAYLNDAAYATSIFIYYTITVFILFGSLDLTFGTCLQNLIDIKLEESATTETTEETRRTDTNQEQQKPGKCLACGRATITLCCSILKACWQCLNCRCLGQRTGTIFKFVVLIPLYTFLLVILMGMVTAAIVVVPIGRSLGDAPNRLLGFFQTAVILVGAYLFYKKFFKKKTTLKSVLKSTKKIFDDDSDEWENKSGNDKLEKFYEHLIKVAAKTDPDTFKKKTEEQR